MDVDRRTALALLGAGIAPPWLEAAQQHLHTLAGKPQEYKLQFFTQPEHDLIDAMAEMIIPADDRSPGAREARVAAYVDLVVAFSPKQLQLNWKSRLAAFHELSEQLGLQEALEQTARNESKPSTPAESLFVDVKRLTVLGYYTTEIGLLKELQYKGNQALADFPGCRHDPAADK